MNNNNTSLPVSLPEICAPREELLRVLDHAAKRPVVYINAPAGYGKTVAALLWLKKTGRRPAWHSFDEYDDTPALFYMVFCRLLLTVIPQDEKLTAIVNAPAFRDAPVEFTVEILMKADYERGEIVLVLDDFHTISNESILKSLPYVLKRLPENVSVFLLSRSEMPDTFSVLQSVNKVSVVDARELPFSIDEIKKHFASYGRFTTEREAEAIRAYSGGWIILLNTMLLSGNLQIDTKNSKLSYKTFFQKNIWNNLNEEKRLFLMKSAVPDEFTVELCKMLTGVNNCKEHIDLLIRGNANISIAEGSYRYHDLFRDFLLEQLEKSQINKPELYKKTAQYYLGKNDYLAARRYSLRSDDYTVIIESMKKSIEDKNVSLDEYVEFSRIFNENVLPEAVCEKLPFFYVPRYLFYFLVGNAAKFEFFMDKAQALIPFLAKNFPQMMEHALTCCTMDYRINFTDFLAFIRSLPAVTHINDTQQVSTVSFHMPFLHRSVRDFYEFTDHELSETLTKEIWQYLLKENCACFLPCLHAGLYIEQNNIVEASEAFLKARNTLNEKVGHEVGYAIFLGQAEAALIKGDKDAYDFHLNEAKEYIEENDAHYLKRNLWAYEARFGLMDGDKKTAAEWLNNYFVSTSEYEAFYKIYQNLTTARAYIVLGEYTAALNALYSIGKMANRFNRPLDAAEANVLITVIDWTLGKKKEALERLYKQLVLLKPYGFIRVVANEGKAVLPVLAAVIRKLDRERDKDEEMYRFVKEVYLAAYEYSKRFKGIAGDLELKPVHLSKQQTLILELLAKGRKNAQIVEFIGISLNTVRYHTKIVYQKLGVTNAMDAIVKARQLGILK